MKIAIGSDHAGVEYKSEIINFLKEKGIEVEDFGPENGDSVDYPDFAHPVASSIDNGTFKLGILLCGSGNGINMTANKYQGVRSAICWEEEIAEMARLHNNANICTLPARYVTLEKALRIVNIFLNTEFEGGRHENRVNKIARCM